MSQSMWWKSPRMLTDGGPWMHRWRAPEPPGPRPQISDPLVEAQNQRSIVSVWAQRWKLLPDPRVDVVGLRVYEGTYDLLPLSMQSSWEGNIMECTWVGSSCPEHSDAGVIGDILWRNQGVFLWEGQLDNLFRDTGHCILLSLVLGGELENSDTTLLVMQTLCFLGT